MSDAPELPAPARVPVRTAGPVRVVATELAFVAGGWAWASLLLGFLHREWQPLWAVVCALLGGIALRRVVMPTYRPLPPFLRGPLDVAIGLLGAGIAAWATMVRFSLPYWALRWREAVSLAGLLLVVGLAVAALVYTYRRLAAEVERREAQMAQLREAGLHARLSALQAQINPHFLFNALNSLAELVHGDPDVAEDRVGDLAHLLRYSLRSSASGLVPLDQELHAVDRYLNLERVRLGDRLKVRVDVDPDLRRALVPGLSVQPLVENAVRHAVASRPEGGSIRIAVEERGDQLRIAVEDDGPGLPDEVRQRLASAAAGEGLAAPAAAGTGGAGGGLANVQQRMMLSYAGAGGLSVSEPDGGGTRLELLLPREAVSLPAPPEKEDR